ncbi:MAG: hypothetical protein WDW38_009391 [Sanguina aurantia]
MAEQLGGSRGRNDGLGNSLGSSPGGTHSGMGMGASKTFSSPGAGGARAAFGGGAIRPSTARPGIGAYPGASGSPGEGGGGAKGRAAQAGRPARPSSAPRERAGPGGSSLSGGSGARVGAALRARVEETRQLTEAQFWGRVEPARRDLPAFWSVATHGQPFNDPRLANGVNNIFKILQPGGAKMEKGEITGPAAMQQARMRGAVMAAMQSAGSGYFWTVRAANSGKAPIVTNVLLLCLRLHGPAQSMARSLRSLECGQRLFNMADLSALPPGMPTVLLSDAEREFLLSKMTPHQRIHSLRKCMDRNAKAANFTPWPLVVLPQERNAPAGLWMLTPLPPNLPHHPSIHVQYTISDWHHQPDTVMRLALQKIENWMRRHLKYLSEAECARAHAPAAFAKDILRRAFWKVDPARTGTVSIQQFLQVWQNVLCLIEYSDQVQRGANHKELVSLKPGARIMLDRNMAAGLFVKYGFDKEGLLPYVVFVQSLCSTPARLLGHDLVLNKKAEGRNGLETEADIAFCVGDAKIEYRYCKSGVFPPSGFDPRVARRSMALPRAHMWLEHVYGYAGITNTANNLFYTHKCDTSAHGPPGPADKQQPSDSSAGGHTEMVYYSGAVGIVFDKTLWDRKEPCQKFFFGHDNDIECLAIHPNRRFVATGQQLREGSVPYACVWDVDTCEQLQRLDHDHADRGVICVGFSGNINGSAAKKGGDILITVTCDDKHTIHIWNWMTLDDKYSRKQYIPGWYFGPTKKLDTLRAKGNYYGYEVPMDIQAIREECQDEAEKQIRAGQLLPDHFDSFIRNRQAEKEAELKLRWRQDTAREAAESTNFAITSIRDVAVKPDAAEGYGDVILEKRKPGSEAPKGGPPMEEGFTGDGSFKLLASLPGCNGTPPMVYGIEWNPLRPQDGRRGSEFASYGVKHLKVWVFNDTDQWQGTNATFGTTRITNVLSIAYVPAMHTMAAPGDSCILSGFPSGEVGLWVPPYPTRAGSPYQLTKIFEAHKPGPFITLTDGTQVNGGVRVIRLREGGRGVLTGGADGCVMSWRLDPPTATRADGTDVKGVKLTSLVDDPNQTLGPAR